MKKPRAIISIGDKEIGEMDEIKTQMKLGEHIMQIANISLAERQEELNQKHEENVQTAKILLVEAAVEMAERNAEYKTAKKTFDDLTERVADLIHRGPMSAEEEAREQELLNGEQEEEEQS